MNTKQDDKAPTESSMTNYVNIYGSPRKAAAAARKYLRKADKMEKEHPDLSARATCLWALRIAFYRESAADIMCSVSRHQD